jgi:hypothetical protein
MTFGTISKSRKARTSREKIIISKPLKKLISIKNSL